MLKNYNKKITFANHNYCRGDFFMKNNDKKDKKNKKNKSKSKFNDYTSFLNPEIVASDPQGM